MTLTDYARKYNIPMNIAHSASYITNARRDCDFRPQYDEKDLSDAIKEDLEKKIMFHEGKIAKYRSYIERTRIK